MFNYRIDIHIFRLNEAFLLNNYLSMNHMIFIKIIYFHYDILHVAHLFWLFVSRFSSLVITMMIIIIIIILNSVYPIILFVWI